MITTFYINDDNVMIIIHNCNADINNLHVKRINLQGNWWYRTL